MTKLYKTIKNCRICNNKISLLHKYRKTPLGEDFIKKNNNKKQPLLNLNLCICKKCKLVQISEIVNPNSIYKNYLYETKTSITLDKHFKKYALNVCKNLKLRKKDLIVDIGSNDGILLKYFKEKNCQIVGIEPAKHISKEANKNGIYTINSFFNKKCVENLNRNFGKAKVITANNVFANIENINRWIELIKLILKKDGFFIFESFYLSDLLKNKVFDFIYHEHHSAFSIKPVIYLCKINGLKLVHVERTESKGGSLRYYICRNEYKLFNKTKTLNMLLKKEVKDKIYSKLTYKNFFKKINLEKDKLLNFIKKNKDIKVFGFGASITCVTLIYQFFLEKKIKFLFDDNRIKQGMLSPRDKILVKNVNSQVIKKDSILLILAWRYQKSIIKRHIKFFKKIKYLIQVMPSFKKLKIK